MRMGVFWSSPFCGAKATPESRRDYYYFTLSGLAARSGHGRQPTSASDEVIPPPLISDQLPFRSTHTALLRGRQRPIEQKFATRSRPRFDFSAELFLLTSNQKTPEFLKLFVATHPLFSIRLCLQDTPPWLPREPFYSVRLRCRRTQRHSTRSTRFMIARPPTCRCWTALLLV